MKLSSLAFLIFVLCGSLHVFADVTTSEFVPNYIIPYQYLYPSFERTDLTLDPISSEYISCPDKCIECKINEKGLVCTKCEYGAVLYQNNCRECPENCARCVDYPLEWGNDRFCIDSGQYNYYFFENEKFEKCSDNCLICESTLKCLTCQDGYFLKYNSLNNYSCLKCSDFTNCITCFIANKTQIIDSSKFEIITSIETYNSLKLKYNWDIVCKSCPSNYFRKADSKCYNCADEISGCIECKFISKTKKIEDFGENLILQDLTETFFVFCMTCDEEKNKFLQVGEMTDILPSKCIECKSIFPSCKTCQNHLITMMGEIGSLKSIFDFFFFAIFSVNTKLECIECPNKFYLVFDNNNIPTCKACPSNCEYCYISQTIICGRCEENYVLSFYEGTCYHISLYTNITDAYKNSCSRIISENPWGKYFLESSPFLCQMCQDSSYYPSMNGNCMKCVDPKCNSCIEASNAFWDPSTVHYTELLRQSPLSLLNRIKVVTSVSSIQRCLACSGKNGYDPNSHVCCEPYSEITTPAGIKTLLGISGCQLCSECYFTENSSPSCNKCNQCENVTEELLNDDSIIVSANPSSPFFAKKIYYLLKTEGYKFNTTPLLDDVETYTKIYNSLTFQKQLDYVGRTIHKCTPCPVNSIDCRPSYYTIFPPEPSLFKIDDLEFYDLISYYLVSKKCRENFVFDFVADSSRCKFCPNKWRNCKAYKALEIKFIGQSKLINETSMVQNIKDLITLFKNLEKSEFAYICNEFFVQELTIKVILDTDEIILWENADSFSMVLDSSLKSLIPSLKKYELIFIPKNYDEKTFATLRIGCYIMFKGFTTIQFINIIFKPTKTIGENLEIDPIYPTTKKLIPYIDINVPSILIKRCFLMYDPKNFQYRILDEEGTILLDLLSFSLKADIVIKIEDFEVHNLKLQNYNVWQLLNIYFFFEIHAPTIHLKNLTFESLFIDNILAMFNFPANEGSSIKLENINILNCILTKSIFFRVGSFLSFHLNYIRIYNTTFEEKPLFTSLDERINQISINNIRIEKSNFVGNDHLNYVFSINIFDEVKNVVIENSYVYRTIIFFFIEKSLSPDSDFYFQNIVLIHNVLENYEERLSFLAYFEFSEMFGLTIHCENISIENNLMKLPTPKANIYAFKFKNLNSIVFEICSFFNNLNVSAVNLDTLNSVQFHEFKFSKNSSIIDKSQDQLIFYMANVQNIIKFESLNIDSIFSQQGLIVISQVMKYEMNMCQIIFLNSILNNIFIQSLNLASAIMITSLRVVEINIIESKFTNLILNDQSQFQKSSTAIYIDSSVSTCKIEKSSFLNAISDGESIFIKMFVESLVITESTFNSANYFNKFNFMPNINSQGSFINAFLMNLQIESSFFLKAYSLNGGGIYSNLLNKETKIEINNCTFENLHALAEAGALFITKNNDKKFTLRILNSTFKHLSALVSEGTISIKASSNSQIFINNSFFSNIYSASSSLFSVSNIDVKLSFVNISENFNVFSEENLKFLPGLIDVRFASSIQIGSLIKIKSGHLSLNNCNFYNLTSSTLESEGTILDCQNCEVYDNGSLYENIYFWRYAFSGTNAIFFIKESTFRNLSASFFSSTILIDGVFLEIRQDLYYSVFFLTYSQFNLSEVTAENIECLNCVEGGGLLLASISTINILFSKIRSNDCVYGFFNIIESSIILNSSYFERNVVLRDGGSLFSKECNVLIYNSSFISNAAINGAGGAIYFYSENKNSFSIINSYFENNIANIGGAIFYQKISILIDSLTVFKKNKALLYGTNLFSFPFSLCFSTLNKCEEKKLYIESFRSGSYLNNIQLKLLDEEGNLITHDNATSPTVSMKLFALTSNSSAAESQFYSMNYTKSLDVQMNREGTFAVENLLLIGKPENDIQIDFSSPQIMTNVSTTGLKKIRNYTISLFVHFRTCEIGEFYQKLTSTCFLCLNGSYSFNQSIEICNDCPQGLTCLGGAETVVHSTFWRRKKFSEKIVYCSMNPENCVGGKENQNNLCYFGHIGAKCESCDLMGRFWNTSFSRTTNFGCARCDEITDNYIILAFLSLFNFLSMILSIKGTIDNINTRLKLQVIKRLARYGMFFPRKNESSIYLKIYFSYLQIIQVLSVINLTYPTWINLAATTVGAPTDSVLYSTDCMVSEIVTSIPYIHVKLIVGLIIPIIYLFIFTFGYIIFMRKSKYHHKYSVLYTVCLFTLLYFQPNIINHIISVLSCVQVGDEKYIKADVAFDCNGEEYYYYSILIGIPTLIFWAFATPLAILFQLIKNRKNLNAITNQIRYGYLYDEYSIFFWEFVRMYEKILITVIISFFESDILIKALLVLLVLFIYSLFLFKYHPYKTKRLNRADKFNTIACYLSIFLGILAYKNPYDAMVSVIYVIILLINIFFNLYILNKIFASLTVTLRHNIRELFFKLQEKSQFKKFLRFFPKRKKNYWLIVRRVLSKYLREKEKITLSKIASKTDEEKYRLSIDYTPYKFVMKKMKNEFDNSDDEEKSHFSSFEENFTDKILYKGDTKTFNTNSNSKNNKEEI